MPDSHKKQNADELSRAPRTGVRLMIFILVAIALVAVYANIQKARRGKIETVNIIPVPTATPAASSPPP